MSHTQCLWKAIQKTDKRFLIRGFMAADAPPNWSYAAYEYDRGRHKADVAIIGILTDTVPQITAITGMTAFFDSNFPYTFPVLLGLLCIKLTIFLFFDTGIYNKTRTISS